MTQCQLCNKKEATTMWSILRVCMECYEKEKRRDEEHERIKKMKEVPEKNAMLI